MNATIGKTFGKQAWTNVRLRGIGRDLGEAGQHIKLGNDIAQQTQWLYVTTCNVNNLRSNAPLLFCVFRLHLQTQVS